jgi:hypothetical protein
MIIVRSLNGKGESFIIICAMPFYWFVLIDRYITALVTNSDASSFTLAAFIIVPRPKWTPGNYRNSAKSTF